MAHLASALREGWSGHGLTITIGKRDAQRASLRLVGELDLASVPILEACLQNQLATGTRYVRVDLSGVAFMDCTGLGVLVMAHHEFLAARGTLVITGATLQARRIMRIAAVDDVLFVAADYPPGVALPA